MGFDAWQLGVWCLGLGVGWWRGWGLGFWIGFGIWGLGLGSEVWEFGFRVWGLGFEFEHLQSRRSVPDSRGCADTPHDPLPVRREREETRRDFFLNQSAHLPNSIKLSRYPTRNWSSFLRPRQVISGYFSQVNYEIISQEKRPNIVIGAIYIRNNVLFVPGNTFKGGSPNL